MHNCTAHAFVGLFPLLGSVERHNVKLKTLTQSETQTHAGERGNNPDLLVARVAVERSDCEAQ